MKQGCASPAAELLEFFKEMERDFWKNRRSLSSDKRSLMFWGAIQSDGRKLLVKCPNELYAVSYLEILQRKMHFLDIIFQQDNAPVHKSKIIGNIFPRKRVEGTEMASIQYKSESYWKLMDDFEATITKTEFFLGEIRRKSVWNLEWNWPRRREKHVWKLYQLSARRQKS